MLHEEWKKTIDGQRVMANCLLLGFIKRKWKDNNCGYGPNTIKELTGVEWGYEKLGVRAKNKKKEKK